MTSNQLPSFGAFRMLLAGLSVNLIILSTLASDKLFTDKSTGPDTIVAAHEWRFVLADTAGTEFSQTCDTRSSKKYWVSRVCVEAMNYDGPPGYTAILVRYFDDPGPGIRHEVMTAFPSGQYRLCLFEPDRPRIHGYALEQRGATVYLSGLHIFTPDNPYGEPVGPAGLYQYATCNPAGTHCLFVDKVITVYDLVSGAEATIDVRPAIAHNASDPSEPIGGFNLSGEYMAVIWTTDTTGKLVLRDEAGRPYREIDIDLANVIAE